MKAESTMTPEQLAAWEAEQRPLVPSRSYSPGPTMAPAELAEWERQVTNRQAPYNAVAEAEFTAKVEATFLAAAGPGRTLIYGQVASIAREVGIAPGEAAAVKRRLGIRLVPIPIVHGLRGWWRGCICDLCRAAGNAKQRERYHRRKERNRER